jgi:hypothetical protein
LQTEKLPKKTPLANGFILHLHVSKIWIFKKIWLFFHNLTSRGLASVGDLVSQMYRLKNQLPSTKPTLKFA